MLVMGGVVLGPHPNPQAVVIGGKFEAGADFGPQVLIRRRPFLWYVIRPSGRGDVIGVLVACAGLFGVLHDLRDRFRMIARTGGTTGEKSGNDQQADS